MALASFGDHIVGFSFSSPVWFFRLPCLSILHVLETRLKGTLLDKTLCIFQLFLITVFLFLGQHPTHAKLLLCFQSGMKSCPDASGCHEQPLRSWIMQPESEGEFTWLLPNRKQEKGRSQRNSPSFLPPCIPSGEVLFAKQTCLLSFFMTGEGGPAANSSRVDVHLSLFSVPFSFNPNTLGCTLMLPSGSTF